MQSETSRLQSWGSQHGCELGTGHNLGRPAHRGLAKIPGSSQSQNLLGCAVSEALGPGRLHALHLPGTQFSFLGDGYRSGWALRVARPR